MRYSIMTQMLEAVYYVNQLSRSIREYSRPQPTAYNALNEGD